MLRCEVGDLSGKNGKITVGGGQLLFNDVNLPLFGRNAGTELISFLENVYEIQRFASQ